MNWVTILLIIFSGLFLLFVIYHLMPVFYQIKANKMGINIVFYNAYNVIKQIKGNEVSEEFAIKNAFSGIQQRFPFNTLTLMDVELIIKTLEPFGNYRPLLFSALIFTADCAKDSSFLRNPKQIIYELIRHQEHFRKKNNISDDNGVLVLLKQFYFQEYNEVFHG